MAFFSILIPVYNVEKYLHECMKSVLSQTFTDYEVILIDDGSTDSSGAICDEFAAANSNVSVFHKENEGLLLARRDGIKLAKGQYVMHLDSDDVWAEGVLQSVYDTIQDQQCDVVMFGFSSLYEDKVIPGDFVFPQLTVFEGDDKKKLYELLITTTLLNAVCYKAVKRDIIDIDTDYRGLRSVYAGEDLLQSTPILINAQKVVYLPKRLYYYRKSTGMTCSIKSDRCKSVTVCRQHITKLLEATGYDMQDCINQQYYDYIRLFSMWLIRGYLHSPSGIKEHMAFVFDTDFYKKARAYAFKKTNLLNRVTISCAEKGKYGLISVLSVFMRIRTKILEKVKR